MSTNLRTELYMMLEANGVSTKGLSVTWNDAWLDSIDAMPEGLDKQHEKLLGIQQIVKSFNDVYEGNYDLLPLGEPTPIPTEVQELINQATPRAVTVCDAGSERLSAFGFLNQTKIVSFKPNLLQSSSAKVHL